MVLMEEMEMVIHGVREEGAKEKVWPRVCTGVSRGFLAEGWLHSQGENPLGQGESVCHRTESFTEI